MYELTATLLLTPSFLYIFPLPVQKEIKWQKQGRHFDSKQQILT
jgi:hypothetical protein